MRLIDSHIHLDAPAFDVDREVVVEKAARAGVSAFVVPGTEKQQWPRLRKTTDLYPTAYPAYGLHPYFIDRHTQDDIDELDAWLQREPAVAIGECGLDYYRTDLNRTLQRDYFEAQLGLARRHRLPLIVHARKSLDEVINALRRNNSERGVIHSFSGSLQQAQRLLDLGFLLGFGGALTYDRAQRLRRLIPALPLTRILLETDAPDQVVANHRGQRNEPAWLPQVLHTMAQLRPESAAEIAAATTANACRLFACSP